MMGINIGFGAGGRLGSSWLSSRLTNRFGADLVALHLGEDVLDTNNVVTSWPGRIGATMTNQGVSSFVVGSINGHRGITLTASNDSCLLSNNSSSAAVKTCIAVATTPTVVWPTYGSSVLLNCGTGASGISMQVQNGLTSFYTSTFWAHYIDGVASEDPIPSGTHILEGTTAAGYTDTKYCITGRTDTGGWIGPRVFLMEISRQITSGERSGTVSDLQRYYL